MTSQVRAESSRKSMVLSQMKEQKFDDRDECTQTPIELSLKCSNLADKDVLSKSDPMVVVYIENTFTKTYDELDKTEVIWNNLNPEFVKKFFIDYSFGKPVKLKFEVYDVDSPSRLNDLSRHDFLGETICSVSELCRSKEVIKELQSRPGRGKVTGTLTITVEQLKQVKEKIEIQFCAKHLDRKDVFGSSDPFLHLYRINEDRSETIVHKTEVIKNNLNPVWQPFEISARTLCNNDYYRPIKIKCSDYNRNGRHELIGFFETNLEQMKSVKQYECVNPDKKSKKKTNSGTIRIEKFVIKPVYTFVDYVKAGTNINGLIAVDFTESNGKPDDPTSLHSVTSNEDNAYIQALDAVGRVIEEYDSDGVFPAWGFGAQIPPDGSVSHLFPLNGNDANPYCDGIDGVLTAYRQTLTRVRFSGPTLFAPCVNEAARLAREHCDGGDYFILLILTDGVICDMVQTCEAIVHASSLPLSIIIIGIGNRDFQAMKILDGDDQRLSSNGKQAERDIVQFFEFKQFVESGQDLSYAERKILLAEKVLEEVPEQFLSYMEKKNLKPGEFN